MKRSLWAASAPAWFSLAYLLVTSGISAQPTTAPVQGGSDPPAQAQVDGARFHGSSNSESPAAGDSSIGAQEPSLSLAAPPETFQVDDPMLEPVPAPSRILKDWREALNMVRTQNSDYVRAQAQVEVARGRARMALAGALPNLSGNANYQYHLLTSEVVRGVNPITGEPILRRIPDPREALVYGGTLRIPVLAARNWYDYSTSKRAINQAEMARDDAQRLIIGGLAQAMVTVITTERLSEVTRVNLAAALSTLDLNLRRTRLGAGNAVDVLRSKQEVALSRADVIQADESLQRAREALGDALGLAEPVGITPDLKMDQLRQDARSTCQEGEDPSSRADVRAAKVGAAIAERNATSTLFEHVPTIDLVSTVNHNSNPSITFVQTTWTIGAALTWRLYDGGLRYGERRLNQALFTQAEENARQTERLARIEALQASRGVVVAQKSREIADESRQIAQDNARLARAKFVNGSGTSFDMVDTQRTARQTQIDLTVREFELLRAEIVAFLALASCDL